MRPIGFSTGALARGDVRRALEMLKGRSVQTVELSALRQEELQPLVEQVDRLDLSRFAYVSFHAPSLLDPTFEYEAIRLLQAVHERKWPIIVHPDAMYSTDAWRRFGELLCVENMDKRKSVGQTTSDLALLFEKLPDASFCLDLGHVRQVDPTMSEAVAILQAFRGRLKQLHVSEVNTQSKHDPLTLEAMMAFQRVSRLIPEDIPVILESRVSEEQIDKEIGNALFALNPESSLALAGD